MSHCRKTQAYLELLSRGTVSNSDARKKLYGKPATREEIAAEVARLLLGDEGKNQKPLKIPEIAIALDFHRDTVYEYKKYAIELKLLEVDELGNAKLPERPLSEQFQLFDDNNPIIKEPSVAEWKQDLLSRKGGKMVKTWQTRIRSVQRVCNTLKINPKQLLVSTKNTEKLMKNFIDLYREGNEFEQSRQGDITNVTYIIAQGIRDYCSFYGITWARNKGGVMAQKVPNYAKFGDIRLTDDQFLQADKYLIENYGIDSDIYRWFWCGVESCARFTALFNMSLDYTKHTSKKGHTTYIMSVIESKTEHINGGKWIKFIKREKTQQAIDAIKARGGTRIYDTSICKDKFRDQLRTEFHKLWKHLGISNEYFFNHTTHVLRHIGAHYHLAKKDYNHSLVAEIGGWNTIDELKRSYGKIPPEKVLEIYEKEDSDQAEIKSLDFVIQKKGELELVEVDSN